ASEMRNLQGIDFHKILPGILSDRSAKLSSTPKILMEKWKFSSRPSANEENFGPKDSLFPKKSKNLNIFW
ncbi:MAG: hypothetical protein J6A23_03525, partial [Thermoguttaceae bacterium]|nr:hypothetical protein [Thermoguttaceae bacterium]